MIHIKTFENWFTDIFKDKAYNYWDEYYSEHLNKTDKYNILMMAAEQGNLNRFKHYLIDYDDSRINYISIEGKTVLHYVITGDGNLYDKKKMIQLLIENDIDYRIEHEGKTFYEMIEDSKLKNWFNSNYPEIVSEIEIIINSRKYNL